MCGVVLCSLDGAITEAGGDCQGSVNKVGTLSVCGSDQPPWWTVEFVFVLIFFNPVGCIISLWGRRSKDRCGLVRRKPLHWFQFGPKKLTNNYNTIKISQRVKKKNPTKNPTTNPTRMISF